ncbi:hypothetical protein T06_14341 [Trichinella sp. T6]|nr:hypothetical protein T06_14341 [Trichinella sp. T6]
MTTMNAIQQSTRLLGHYCCIELRIWFHICSEVNVFRRAFQVARLNLLAGVGESQSLEHM